jgi:BirA family transcriptional regulator, biotin operon repressor / biotin---[acetyl-CoA-carboxylase] ligase
MKMPTLDISRLGTARDDGPIGSDLRYFLRVDSTNRIAADLEPGNWSDGTVVITDYQSAGRGRRGRSWIIPPGTGLLLSVMLAPPHTICPVDSVMLAALAAADAIKNFTGVSAEIKWPNDVLIGGRKVCGILAESASQGGTPRLILGLGMNVNVDPALKPDFPPGATSLSWEVGRELDREELALHLFRSLNLWYRCLLEAPDTVFHAWAARLSCVGHPLLIIDARESWTGFGVGVQRDGGLLIRGEGDTVRTVYAADVSVRDMADRADHSLSSR